ncbi:putative holin-like toxin [Listeria kieliensis]|nr:putative holin-like toxin [Listeria kieliensis]
MVFLCMLPRKGISMSVYEALALMIAFATLVLLIRDRNAHKK